MLKRRRRRKNFSLDKKIQILRLTELCYDMKEADDARRNLPKSQPEHCELPKSHTGPNAIKLILSVID